MKQGNWVICEHPQILIIRRGLHNKNNQLSQVIKVTTTNSIFSEVFHLFIGIKMRGTGDMLKEVRHLPCTH